jgi:hypothetical protein
MYGAFYFYFEIRSDASYSKSVDGHVLKSFLSGLDALSPKGDDTYVAANGAPWLSMGLRCADSGGNYASSGTCPEVVSLISVVGSNRDASAARHFYVDLMVEIAAFLRWEVVEEEDEDGNEDVVVWCPG